jgi:hypothetical protein
MGVSELERRLEEEILSLLSNIHQEIVRSNEIRLDQACTLRKVLDSINRIEGITDQYNLEDIWKKLDEIKDTNS